MNATTVALSSPDILHHIFSHGLLPQVDLRTCCLVNSDWAAAGLILLWRYPRCHSLYSFRLLLDTLRHEVDLSGPIASQDSSEHLGLQGKSLSVSAAALRRSATVSEKPSPAARTTAVTCADIDSSSGSTPLQAASTTALIATTYRPDRRHFEYGIPFHGQRIYHRAQFIRELNFGILASTISTHHFEILARSSKLGFRTLDLRKVHLPFSEHLLSILISSKALRSLSLDSVHIPSTALIHLESCLSALTELRLYNCPDSMRDPELTMILRHCSQLKQLELHSNTFTDKSLCWIAKTCVELEGLVIEAPRMTDAVIEQIVPACSRLTSWRLINCIALLDAGIEALEKKYSIDNRAMALSGGRRVAGGQKGDVAIFKRMPAPALDRLDRAHWTQEVTNITGSTLNSSSSSINTSAFSSTASAISSPSMSSVSSHSDGEPLSSALMPCIPPHQGYASFALDRYTSTLEHTARAFGGLATVELRNCKGVQPRLVNSFLKSQQQLQHLLLGGDFITDDALDALTETPLPTLQSLGLFDCGEISDETMVAVMFNCDQMKKLTIYGSRFTLRTFSSISLHLSQLEELHLERVPLIMNESLQDILLRCIHLRVLKLWHCRNLTQDLFTDQLAPCMSLDELEYMDKFPRPYAEDGWETQVRFLQSLVVRCEGLRVLRLAKLADNWVPVNLVSYLCQLDRLERFTILQNHGLDIIDLKELKTRLPALQHVGMGLSDSLSEEQLSSFTQLNHRPGVRMYHRMLESSEDL
ncbi:hypothetical protein EDD11_003718 [Mortierella claussenii]|nr:hypothetical protein EDD11_003718 [Mortierella claussenii]